MKHSG